MWPGYGCVAATGQSCTVDARKGAVCRLPQRRPLIGRFATAAVLTEAAVWKLCESTTGASAVTATDDAAAVTSKVMFALKTCPRVR